LESGQNIKTQIKMTHTQGPLAIVPSSTPGHGTGWRDIVTTTGPYAPVYVGEAMEENALLFAAAPDLLAALQSIATTAGLCAITFPNAPGNGDLQAIVREARSAIAKATNN
jgi:hypothetical protein